MNNKEKILLYLSDSLENPKEFEKELEDDVELTKQFNSIKISLEKTDQLAEGEISEAYFNSIQPEFRKQMERKKKTRSHRLMTYSLSSTVGAVFLFLIINYALLTTPSNLDLYNDLLGEYSSEELMTAIEDEYSYVSLQDEYVPENVMETYLSENFKELQIGDLNPSVVSIYTNDYIESLTDSELESLINILESK